MSIFWLFSDICAAKMHGLRLKLDGFETETEDQNEDSNLGFLVLFFFFLPAFSLGKTANSKIITMKIHFLFRIHPFYFSHSSHLVVFHQ